MFTKKYFANTEDGKNVFLFEQQNTRGTRIQVLNYGGIIKSLYLADATGEKRDIVLGYDALSSYEKQDKYFGALVGRCCNRIGDSCFSIDGKSFKLSANEGKNHLHGGVSGFDKKVWDAQMDGDTLCLRYISAEGEEGYPGDLDVTVTYTLNDEDELLVDYQAVSDRDTIVSLTNHSYFNLNGHDAGSILEHSLRINADLMTSVTEDMIAEGVTIPVSGSPFDFLDYHLIGERIGDSNEQLYIGGGYDHNYIINGNGMRLAAELIGDQSKIKMDIYTDMDGMQLYTGNFIQGAPVGKGGVCYQNRDAVCLETQFVPNAVNCPVFPSPVLRAGEIYHRQTVYRFTTV